MEKGRLVRKNLVRMTFFGKKSNVETARWVYLALLDAFDHLWNDYRIRTGAGRSDRRAFVLGVWNGFSDKMEEERKVMEAERDMLAREQGRTGPGTAIVLASIQEKTAVAFKEKYGKLGKVAKYCAGHRPWRRDEGGLPGRA